MWVGLLLSVGVAGTVMFFTRWCVRHHYINANIKAAAITELMSQWWAAYGALLSQRERKRKKTKQRKKEIKERKFHMSTVTLMSLTAVGGWSLSSAGWRVAAGAWWVAALVVARSYSSGLTSLLAVRTVPVRCVLTTHQKHKIIIVYSCHFQIALKTKVNLSFNINLKNNRNNRV